MFDWVTPGFAQFMVFVGLALLMISLNLTALYIHDWIKKITKGTNE